MSAEDSVIKVVQSYEPGTAAKELGEVKLTPSGRRNGSSLRVAKSDGRNVEQLLAETITAVIKAASNSATKEPDSFRFMHLVLEETCHDVFLGAARELNVDPQKPQDGDFLKVVKKFLSHRGTFIIIYIVI